MAQHSIQGQIINSENGVLELEDSLSAAIRGLLELAKGQRGSKSYGSVRAAPRSARDLPGCAGGTRPLERS